MSDDLHQEYRSFRASHPIIYREVAGVCWEYMICGQGPEALLLLPGGFGAADTAFRYITALEADYRVMSLTYPAAIATVGGLVDGIAAMLDAENIPAAHVLGGSYSGLIAQCLIRRRPDKVASLILSHTGVPRPARARQLELCVRIISALPIALIRRALKLAKYRFSGEMSIERAFWNRYFDDMIDALTKAACVNRFRVAAEVDRHWMFTPGDLSSWAHKVLILEAEADWLVSAAEREALRALYPQARVHTFSGGAHSDTLDKPEAQIAVIASFLKATDR
jgi:pimeloyl-ACP methyl ester carboxylesterase